MKTALILLLCLPLVGAAQAPVRNYYQTCEQQLREAQTAALRLRQDGDRYADTLRKARRLIVLKDQRLDRQSRLILDLLAMAQANASRGGFLGIGNRKRWRAVTARITKEKEE